MGCDKGADVLRGFYKELLEFCKELFSDCENFTEIAEKIAGVEIKNSSTTKIIKKNTSPEDFPRGKFDYETLATYDLFIYVHKVINVKIHLHHSHITGKVIGYAHDFCNEKVRENKDVFSCIAHNFFRFDIYFLIKGIRLSVWDTKEINLGGTGLTNINFGNVMDMKLIDTMKYFLTSLGKLAATIDSIEKKRAEKLTVQFLNNYHYFSTIWHKLTERQRDVVLEIIVSGKRVIPYEKISSIDSLDRTPKDGIFFSKDEFFSTLKGQAVDDESYENSKKLFILLKMRNLSDLNDLYNVQDIILLLEMMENRFQTMYDVSGYNPRILNSASKLSRCIEREKSKIILALPKNNMQMETFEKTVLGGFSCVNTGLSFDTEILMPNLKEGDYKRMNVDESFKAYKRDDLKKTSDYQNFKAR